MDNKLTYNISASENDNIVEIIITGEVADHCIDKLVHEVQAILEPMNPKKLLEDVRSLKIKRSITDIYSLVRNYPPLLRIKTAVVDIPEHSGFESFHETTARNAGILMKYFTDINKAREWLKGK